MGFVNTGWFVGAVKRLTWLAGAGMMALIVGCGGGGSDDDAGMTGSSDAGAPLRIGYSDWPGWVPWEIAREKGFFEANGVRVELVWMDYVPSMEAFAAGQLDAVTMTNGDALVTGATSRRASTAILVNDYSNGNDMIIGRPGVTSVADLAGRRVGVEVGFVDHLLLLHALESAGLDESAVEVIDIPTNEAPQALAAGGVDAIAAWQPSSGQALRMVPGSTTIYSSADAPGIIYDLLSVSRESLSMRREEWLNVVRTWYDVVDYMNDPANRDEMLRILSARVGLPPAEYEPLLEGTYILPLAEAIPIMTGGEELGFRSLAGSSRSVDDFNVRYQVYPTLEYEPAYVDPSLAQEVARERRISSLD